MAQEREFYKYCQLPQRPGLLDRPPASPRTEANVELLPHSSQDTTLTALAQLGALRLNVQRCMISLFDSRNQYILTEATRTLSLQDDRVHLDGDALWLGSSVIPKQDGICHYVCEDSRLNAGPLESDTAGCERRCAFVVPDLTKDDRFNKRQYVVNAPRLRFFAGVPLRSRRGIVIGALSVSDGLTRPNGLTAPETRFMTDTAAAVMNHLDMVRSHEQNRRGANMIAGLGDFVEGGIFPSSSARRRSNVNFDKEDQDGNDVTGADADKMQSSALHSRRVQTQSNRLVVQNRIQRDKSPTPSDPTDQPTSESSAPSTPKSKRETEVTLKSGTREIIGRAARVLQQSLDVQGVVFFDASVKSHASLVRNSDDQPSDGEVSSGSTEALEGSSDSDNLTPGHSSTESDDPTTSDVLGFSLEDPDQPTGAMRETFLQSLLRNYPQGAIFNVDENGSISSSEGSDSSSASTVSREIMYRRHEGPKVQRRWKYQKRHRASLKEENKGLMKIFPCARCVTLFPLWDSRRNRWFSGLFLWTKSPRSFHLGNELAYLYAFSNSVMAEINRLDMELANRAHATLVGSISHELRSPLHGILGSTELLGDSSLTPAQTALVNTVEHCGRSLLDIINNMLDFAKINHFTHRSRSSRLNRSAHQRRSPRSHMRNKPGSGVVNLISDVQLDSVLEEVAESVFAGHCYTAKNKTLAGAPPSAPMIDHRGEVIIASPNERPVVAFNESLTVIYDVAPDIRWLFETQAGAWRRILMNLFGNALKYTHSGHIIVSLKSAAPTPDAKSSRNTRENGTEMASVILTVKDTGQGIDRQYLESNVFKPFSQEDPLSPGSGLGLSIVHQTAVSLGGMVDVSSTKGVGTEVTVQVNLTRIPKEDTTDHSQGQRDMQQTRHLVRDKSIGLIGFGTPWEQNEEALTLLRASLTRMYENHFGMKVGFVAPGAQDVYDIYVVQQAYLGDMEDIYRRASAKGVAPAVLVICSTPQTAQKLAGEHRNLYEFISQPCGPFKMAKALKACVEAQAQEPPVKDIKEPEPKTEESKTSIPLTITPKGPQNSTVTKTDVELSPTSAVATVTVNDNENAVTEISATLEATRIVPSVLLVDDNAVNLQLLMAAMKKAKFPYFTACNGLEALEAYKAHAKEIQVIIMDISMPVMDGLESTREIRLAEKQQRGKAKATTIIALSGLGSASVREEAFNSGVDLFLSKPVRFQELTKQIAELLR
ncbi:hypothetical protein ASPSYDRAFT_42020 [Aspergillus sydowii CBS 593.65]|uniref:Histidine kinase n=1 Tax=Aspergillus sydowii CBS 593.65 TaxID=1036612 RepID=A0A1L9TLI8_9EURO|nr:uncharacterized protein ASPSYDRAFT_42020 [Aspergillus sydowii CBS 593.65]OJJ60297.1 hypothetical protein ASPSYDRAFT_42020 [Aspergillus sydowii CBS 593.65]